ncbi:hypothetical protein LRAMOSA11299 [Lichtheimia ramosa]|uniref:U3 small nucleolar RNA-associated protein 10 n=1 Tax=Lichtheimia ramosa TaxID=688394 RepID=A0A077WUU8_9FUNG|nr:hypothetical protein LRAMOSA11299 [Lichtheimia ramosa]
MSLLQDQLKRIGTADLRNVTEISRRHKPSLLFNSREAADYDLETIYSIAHNGIMELTILDEKFGPFEKTLFSESMKSVDRVLQTPEENAKLDASIAAFLRQLSPYFLLKPAAKAMEWLIRRFRVQDFNVEAVLACIFPYHETKLFAQMVSLLDIKENTSWAFLLPIKKSGTPLDRSLLVKRIDKNRLVLDFVCNTVSKTTVPFKTLYSFYAATITEYINTTYRVGENIVTALLPHIFDGFRAHDIPEFQIASYMIISQLAARTTFSSSSLVTITKSILKHHNEACFAYALLTIVHLAQSQETFGRLSSSSYKRLLSHPDFVKTLQDIAAKYKTDRFMAILLPALCKPDAFTEDKAALINQLILDGILSGDNVRLFVESAIDVYMGLEEEDKKNEYIQQLRPLLVNVSQRYMEDLDTVLETKLKDANGKGALYEFASVGFKGTSHEVVQEANTTLYLCLHSPSPSARLLAVQKLISIMNDTNNPLAKSSDVIESALAESLTDFNDLLLYAVTEIPDQLMDYVPAETIISKLSTLLHESNAMKKSEAVVVLKFLLCDLAKRYAVVCTDVARLLALFAITAPGKHVKRLLKNIDDTVIFSSQVLNDKVQHLKEALKVPTKDKDTPVAKTFIQLEANKIPDNELSIAFWNELAGSNAILDKVIAMLVLGQAITLHPEASAFINRALETVLASLSKQELASIYKVDYADNFAAQDKSLSDHTLLHLRQVTSAKDNVFINLVQHIFITTATSLKRPATAIDWFLLDKNSSTNAYASALTHLFRIFTGGSALGCFETVVPVLISQHLKDDLISFLISVWSSSDESHLVRARALQIAKLYIASYATKNAPAMDFQHILPGLMPVLYEESTLVRIEAIQTLLVVRAAYTHAGLPTGERLVESQKTFSSGAAKKCTIISANSVYASDAIKIADIKSNDAAHFVDFIAGHAREMKEDPSYIFTLIQEFIHLSETSKDRQVTARSKHILDLILHHIKVVSSNNIRIPLLQLLDKVETSRKLENLSLILSSTLNSPRTKQSTHLVELLVRCFVPSNAAHFGAKADKTLDIFLRLLSNSDTLEGEDEDGWQASTRRFALKQITPEFFAKAKMVPQRSLFNSLIDIATNGEQNDVRVTKKILADIDIPVKLIEERLVAFSRSLSDSGAEMDSVKRARKTKDAVKTPSPSVDLYELVTLLELIESINIDNNAALIKPLFDVLAAMINADLRDAPVSLEYISQLIMLSLTRIIRSVKDQNLQVQESILRVDVVVQCIRTTGNPQTHNQALLLMATIASLYPESVLNNIMAVFTFMGANVLRQDDNYSFQVIQQTLEKIIPPMVESSRRKNPDNTAMALQVKPIIKVFVGALFHIPKHRRLPLFTVLVRTMGEDEFLYAIISLLLEKYANRVDKEDDESVAVFSQMLSQQFSTTTQIKAVNSLLLGLLALPNDKVEDGDVEMQAQQNIFDVNEHNAKELRRYKLLVMSYVDLLLGSRGFLIKIMEEQDNINFDLYLETVEILLKLVSYFASFRDEYSVSEGAKISITKFWRNILKVVFDVLDKVNGLLPLDAFVKVVTHLIKHQETAIRRKAMNLFNERINMFEVADEDEEQLLVNMVKEFTAVIENESNMSGEEDSAINKQSALMCISSLTSILGNVHPAAFVDALPTILGAQCLQLANTQVKITSLSCLAVIIQETGPRSVPHLPKFMPVVLDIFVKNVQAEKPSQMLRLAVLGSIGTIVAQLPHFMSPYLPKLLDSLLSPSIHEHDENDMQRTLAEQKATEVLTTMATSIPPRVLLTPVFACYETVVKYGRKSILALLSLIADIIRNTTREVMTSHYKQLFKFFLLAFDIRRQNHFDDSVTDELEDSTISVFLDLVMKLNETLFKPLFLKVVDWALMELAEAKAEEGYEKRVIFFYKLVDSLLGRLKSIFTPYYNYVIDDVITRLQATEEPSVLWNHIMSSLSKSFLYDNDNLWNASKFDKILDPVINQMSVMGSDETPDQYMTRMTTYLVPCLGQMAVTVSNDTLWKPMNHKVLMKTREDSPEIRLAALKCLEEFYVRLGEEWLLFLAESISFLAELMEDDDPRVEKLVQQVNAQIEVHLGESLDKFFI